MSAPSNSLVIFLHGVGANGADLAPLADTLLPFLPSSVFASPDGPEQFDGGGSGRQWFSVAGVTQANRSERVRHARAAFDRVVSSEIEKHGFAGRFDRIAFFGFSQGAIMALDAVATGRWPVRAVVAASGRLATAPEAKTEHLTKILLMHGENDPVIAAQEISGCGGTAASRWFRGRGETLSGPGSWFVFRRRPDRQQVSRTSAGSRMKEYSSRLAAMRHETSYCGRSFRYGSGDQPLSKDALRLWSDPRVVCAPRGSERPGPALSSCCHAGDSACRFPSRTRLGTGSVITMPDGA